MTGDRQKLIELLREAERPADRLKEGIAPRSIGYDVVAPSKF
jgi:hypothetical protein